jgi:hypothetical protein
VVVLVFLVMCLTLVSVAQRMDGTTEGLELEEASTSSSSQAGGNRLYLGVQWSNPPDRTHAIKCHMAPDSAMIGGQIMEGVSGSETS